MYSIKTAASKTFKIFVQISVFPNFPIILILFTRKFVICLDVIPEWPYRISACLFCSMTHTTTEWLFSIGASSTCQWAGTY